MTAHGRGGKLRTKFGFKNWLLIAGLSFVCAGCGASRNVTTASESEPASNPPAETSASAPRPIARRAAATRFEQNLPPEILLPDANDSVSSRILKDYGAIFAARGGAVPPPRIVFEDEAQTAAWQDSVPKRAENFGVSIELQEPAMRALLAARNEARRNGLNLTVRGTWGAGRDYRDTEKIWATRVKPGLQYWTARGKISASEAARIRSLAPPAQVGEILRLEAQGIFFSKDFSKSILYSATAPGCSQHLSMLAVDLNENGNPAVRSILAKHGWFQTVISDLPHFTFLGVAENELPALGLKKTVKDNRVYWTPE